MTSQVNSQPGSEHTALQGGADVDGEAEGGMQGIADDADTEEEQIDANIAVELLDMAEAGPSGVEGSQASAGQWTTEASVGEEEGSRKKSRIGLKVKFSSG